MAQSFSNQVLILLKHLAEKSKFRWTVNRSVCTPWRSPQSPVQYLAEQFWIRWRREYIQNLQVKTKWNREHRNLAVDDIVLMKDEQAHRNNWPLGRVVHAIKSEDGRVRRATVLICRDGQKRTYERPIGALVLLVPSDEHSVR